MQYNSIIVDFMRVTRQQAGWRDPAIRGGFAEPSALDCLNLQSDEDSLETLIDEGWELIDILDSAEVDGLPVRVGEASELEACEEELTPKLLDKLAREARTHFSEAGADAETLAAEVGATTMTDAWRDFVGPWAHEFDVTAVNAKGQEVAETVRLGYQGGESVDDPAQRLLDSIEDRGYAGWLLGQEDLERLSRDVDWNVRQEMLVSIRGRREDLATAAMVLLSLADDEDALELVKTVREAVTESRKRCGNGVVDKTPGQHVEVSYILNGGRSWTVAQRVVPNATGEMQLKGCWWHVLLTKEQLDTIELMVPVAKAEADAKKAAAAVRWTAKQERTKRFETCMAWLAKPQTDANLLRAAKAFVARYWGAADGSTAGSITRCFKTGDWSDCYLDTKQGAQVKQAFSALGYSTKRGW